MIKEWLETYIGKTATARLCTHGVVDYTVAERSFSR